MNILIICTYYPPDTAVAAKRPYYLAKYLSQHGNKVTVVKSGLINKIVDDFYEEIPDVMVYSYLANDTVVRSSFQNHSIPGRSRISFLPYSIRKVVSRVFHAAMEPANVIKTHKETKYKIKQFEGFIKSIENDSYDIVFSTFGEVENIELGRIAAKKFNSKWVMDFRDIICQTDGQTLLRNWMFRKWEKTALEVPDLCTFVSNGLMSHYLSRVHNRAMVIFNGFERDKFVKTDKLFSSIKSLRICYTGQVYERQLDAAGAFTEVLAYLVESGQLDEDGVVVDYAGPNGDVFKNVFLKRRIERMFVDHGYINKTEIRELQSEADIFLVLSWNTVSEQGILTGKFYEGIGADKPIIAVVAGDEANSELLALNKQFMYGFCYETVNKKEMFSDFCRYIKICFDEKKKNGEILAKQSDDIKNRFNYQNIASELEIAMKNLISEDVK